MTKHSGSAATPTPVDASGQGAASGEGGTCLSDEGLRIAYAACPLCDSESFGPDRTAKADNGETLFWMRCECGHSFTRGYFTAEGLAGMPTPDCQRVGYMAEDLRLPNARLVERVTPYRNAGAWLDVGFGNGALLFTAAEFGFSPVGIDLREQTVMDMQARGVACWCCELTDLAVPPESAERLAVISLCDVLEHMPFPKQALQHARKLLADDGVLLLTLPNMDAPVWRMLDEQGQNPYWGEIEHFHNFGRARLYRLLSECGFKPVSYGVSERYRVGMEVVCVSC